jgi:hypothetical protein
MLYTVVNRFFNEITMEKTPLYLLFMLFLNTLVC